MAQVGSLVANKAAGMFRTDSGLAFALAELSQKEGLELASIPAGQIVAENVAFELV